MTNSSKSVQRYTLDDLDAAIAERSLREFVKQAWHVLEPGTPLVWGWYQDAICEHLEAVTRGEIADLLINMPPRCMKSLLVSVFWVVWTWLKAPETRWLCSSYAQSLSTRDSVKCRRLIESPWFQARWGRRFKLTGDQNQKTRFDNTKTGYRLATSVGGAATGEGGDFLITDDPISVADAGSDVVRRATNAWWDETMATRRNDINTSHRVIVMQRVHAEDLSGHVLAEGGYVHLSLPMEYEGNRAPNAWGWRDPRTVEGETLDPLRFPPLAIAGLKRSMGSYAAAGQLQQRPAPRAGGMIQVDQIEIVDAAPATARRVRYWDKAGTEGGGDYSAGALVSETPDGIIYIEDIRRGQWSSDTRNRTMTQTAQLDGRRVVVWVEQEPGSGGKESAEISVKLLRGYDVHIERVTGAKATRAAPFAAQVEAGNVKMVRAPWNQDFLEEARDFPNGKHDDQVDAVGGAYAKLALEPPPPKPQNPLDRFQSATRKPNAQNLALA